MLDLSPSRASAPAWFSLDDVAMAAGVPVDQAWRLVALGQAVVSGRDGLVSPADAVHLVRVLRGDTPLSPNRVPFNQLPPGRRRAARIVGFAGVAYGLAAIVMILLTSAGLMRMSDPDALKVTKDEPVKLVYLMMPGPGGGIGPGSGGGTGGGPYQPGAGIDPPTLVKEIRPTYTDAARRQAIEGDVVLEIVVRSDGSVGNVRVRRTLGAGLEQKAIDAVRQWRFLPAKRHGTAVDVVVDVSVEFKLR
jgi:TonB family protein